MARVRTEQCTRRHSAQGELAVSSTTRAAVHTAGVSTSSSSADIQFFRAVLAVELRLAVRDALLALLEVVTSAGAGGGLLARWTLAHARGRTLVDLGHNLYVKSKACAVSTTSCHSSRYARPPAPVVSTTHCVRTYIIVVVILILLLFLIVAALLGVVASLLVVALRLLVTVVVLWLIFVAPTPAYLSVRNGEKRAEPARGSRLLGSHRRARGKAGQGRQQRHFFLQQPR